MSAKPPQPRIEFEMPPDLGAVYANFALISHSASEVFINFGQMLPGNPKPRINARVIITPRNAKLMLRALQDNLEKYESQFGEIHLPSEGDELARQFFGGPKPPEP